MPITDHIKQVAERTIGLIQDYYKRNPNESFQEQEARISRIERAMEACNGFEPEEKLQRVAENVFEITCSWEVGTDAIKDKISSLETKLDKLQTESLEMDEKLSNAFMEENLKTRQAVQALEESIKAMPPKKWYEHLFDFLEKTKWAIVVVILIIIGGMVYNPQIIELFTALTEKIK